MVKQCLYYIILGVYLLYMLHSCVVVVCATNLYTSYLIQIDTDSYRILGKKYRLPSPKCDRSVPGVT